MIYLKEELAQFMAVKQDFEDAYIALLEEALRTYRDKGVVRDTNSPIHHRMSPMQMLSLVQAKGRRVESILSRPDWNADPKIIDKVIEECGDIVNYCLFIAALCTLLLKEMKQ